VTGSAGAEEGARRRAGEPDQSARSTGQGVAVNRKTADAFAANVLPIVRQIQAAGATTCEAPRKVQSLADAERLRTDSRTTEKPQGEDSLS
jgi:hypothetical protein